MDKFWNVTNVFLTFYGYNFIIIKYMGCQCKYFKF